MFVNVITDAGIGSTSVKFVCVLLQIVAAVLLVIERIGNGLTTNVKSSTTFAHVPFAVPVNVKVIDPVNPALTVNIGLISVASLNVPPPLATQLYPEAFEPDAGVARDVKLN